MLIVIGKLLKLGFTVGLAITLFNLFAGSGDIEPWRDLYYGSPMTRHEVCPHCEADLSAQRGFESDAQYWTCTDCGKNLQHPDLFNYDDEIMVPICPFCDSDLSEQGGFSEDLPYWICEKCGAELISPESEYDYAWFCDECGAFLNDQDGFSEGCNKWKCDKCGCVNNIEEGEVIGNGNPMCNN